MSQSLTDFFRKKQAQAASEDVDWDQRKAEWLAALNSLYDLITKELSEAVAQKFAQISMRPKQITEEHLGSYEASELLLTVGDEQVVFSPKGRNIVGATGRVDVRGEMGEAMLVVQPGPRWSVVKSKYPTLKMIALDENTLAETLRAVMRQ